MGSAESFLKKPSRLTITTIKGLTMTEVYIVRKLSDFHPDEIRGVFTNREEADRIAEKVAEDHYRKMRYDEIDKLWSDYNGNFVHVSKCPLDKEL